MRVDWHAVSIDADTDQICSKRCFYLALHGMSTLSVSARDYRTTAIMLCCAWRQEHK